MKNDACRVHSELWYLNLSLLEPGQREAFAHNLHLEGQGGPTMELRL